MKIKYCPHCGKATRKISSKEAKEKVVCLDCELTYKVLDSEDGRDLITVKSANEHQMVEASMAGNGLK